MVGMLFQLAMALSQLGDTERARATCDDALGLSAAHGERWRRSYTLYVLAFDIWRLGDPEQANRTARDGLAIKADFADYIGAALIVELLAGIAASEGDFAGAAGLLGAAQSIWGHHASPIYAARTARPGSRSLRTCLTGPKATIYRGDNPGTVAPSSR